jgi:hypothetical protein
MKAILIKANNHYYLEQIPSKGVSGSVLEGMIGSTDGEGYYKLSKQNCDEIFGVVDVEKLAEERFGKSLHHANSRSCYKEGFNKAMELNKDKQFTLEDIRMAIAYGEKHRDMDAGKVPYQTFVEFIPSLKQLTEIEVEIEMETCSMNPLDLDCDEIIERPKLDSDGCLILKKIEQ